MTTYLARIGTAVFSLLCLPWSSVVARIPGIGNSAIAGIFHAGYVASASERGHS